MTQTYAERRKIDPKNDLLTRLVIENSGDTVDDNPLTEQELQNILRDFILGGFGTVDNMLGNSLYLLLRHPDQMEKLRRHPELMPNFIDECLRFSAGASDTSELALPFIP